MLPRSRNGARIGTRSVHVCRMAVLALALGAVLLAAQRGHAWQQDQQKGSMPGMDMSSMGDLKTMGPSMMAMAGHVIITPVRLQNPARQTIRTCKNSHSTRAWDATK